MGGVVLVVLMVVRGWVSCIGWVVGGVLRRVVGVGFGVGCCGGRGMVVVGGGLLGVVVVVGRCGKMG